MPVQTPLPTKYLINNETDSAQYRELNGNSGSFHCRNIAEHTPGEWGWWTSNSWRRLRSEQGHGKTVSVIEPYVCKDGHPDCMVSDADMALIAAAPGVLAALEPFADVDGEGDGDYSDDTKVTVTFGRTTFYSITLGYWPLSIPTGPF